MALKGVSAPAVVIMGAGGLFLWSGLKGAKVSTAARSLLQGKQPTVPNPAPNQITGAAYAAQFGSGTPVSGSAPPGDTSAHDARARANQAAGRLLAASYGWGAGQQWADLLSLWNQESGWDQYAKNSSSGAYGIAQALPPTKYPPAAQEAGGSSATAQMLWGLAYIKQRYGSPSAAWAHEKANNWY